MRKLLIFLIFLLPSLAWSSERYDDLRVGVYAYTQHLTPGGYNDHHPMLQLEYQRRWVGGVFLNSASRWSWYAAYRMQSDQPWRPFVEAGAATGYGPPVVRSLRIGIELHNNMDLLFMPGFVDQHTWRINEAASVVAIVLKL